MIGLLKQTLREFTEDNCTQMAAALAYYTIFSLPPLLVVVVSVAGYFVEPQNIQQRLGEEIRAVVGEGGTGQVATMIEHAQQPGRGLWGTIVGIAMLLFGATGVMVQLQAALNQAWEVMPDPGQGSVATFLTKRILSLAMILAFSFLLLVSLVVTVIIKGLEDQVGGWLPGGSGDEVFTLLHNGLSCGIITVLFAAMFKYLPDAKVSWRDVWFGAAITAFLFVLAKWGLGVYLGHSDIASTYGAAGAMALILIWVYYSGIILLFGAEFTQVRARSRGAGIVPAEGAIANDAKRSARPRQT